MPPANAGVQPIMAEFINATAVPFFMGLAENRGSAEIDRMAGIGGATSISAYS